MSGNVFLMKEGPVESVDRDHSNSVKVLAVGEPEDWLRQGKALPTGSLAFVAYHEVSAETLGQHQPEVVYSPVLARSFDCIELAMLLHNLGFGGTYNAYASDLPKPELVEREVRQICPRLLFRIVTDNV